MPIAHSLPYHQGKQHPTSQIFARIKCRNIVYQNYNITVLGLVFFRAVAGGMLNNIKKGELDSLVNALKGGNHTALLEKVKDPHESNENITKEGNDILGHVMGSKDVSRQVAETVGKEQDLDAQLIKAMLPIIAIVVMGLLSQNVQQHGSQQVGDGLLGMLDMNQNGSPLDDILQIISGASS